MSSPATATVRGRLLDIDDKFRSKQIPLDNVVLDYFWWKGEFNNILEWNEPFPGSKGHDGRSSTNVM